MAEQNHNGVVRKRHGGFRYLTREGIRNVWSNRLMSTASVIVLTSCLFLIGIAAMLSANLNAALQDVQKQNVIMVYLEDDIKEGDSDIVGQEIRLLPEVEDAVFVSKEEAYQDQLKRLGEDASLMDGLGTNPLPDAYEVTLKDLSHYSTTIGSLEKINHVQKVRGNTELAAKVRQLRSAVQAVSIGVIVMLLLVSFFIIANTIRVTMYNRRLEISIMKAVGATDSFIRWPFLIEGGVIGLISGVLAELFVWLVYEIAKHSLGDSLNILGGSLLPFSQYAGWLLLAFWVIGILAGVLGSLFSLGRYLKVQGSEVTHAAD